ncbi:MAG: peptidylprolyl isomerase [Bacteroidota bacterium]
MNLKSILLFLLSFHFLMVSAQSGKDEVVILTTNYGEMTILLYDQTPKHKANFLKLAKEGFYTGTGFHRVIKGFMIQGGDPNSKEGGDASKMGQGGPGYTQDAEFVKAYTHKRGALAAARQGDQVNPQKASSGSQFYIVQNPDACRHLNGSYTIFGQVIQGLEVVDTIANQEVNRGKGNVPKEPIRLTEVTVKKMSRKKIAQLYGAELLFAPAAE